MSHESGQFILACGFPHPIRCLGREPKRNGDLFTYPIGTGMLASASTIEMVANQVVKYKVASLVVDPVSKAGQICCVTGLSMNRSLHY